MDNKFYEDFKISSFYMSLDLCFCNDDEKDKENNLLYFLREVYFLKFNIYRHRHSEQINSEERNFFTSRCFLLHFIHCLPHQFNFSLPNAINIIFIFSCVKLKGGKELVWNALNCLDSGKLERSWGSSTFNWQLLIKSLINHLTNLIQFASHQIHRKYK